MNTSRLAPRGALAVFYLALVAACGGGGGSGSGSPPPAAPPAPPPVAVTVSPSSFEVDIGDTAQFAATVTGTSNTGVTWQVNDVPGGNSTVGTISSAGLYTSPSELPANAAITIRAVSAADATRSGSAAGQLYPRFSNRTLNGRYAFQLSGTDGDVVYTAIGSFVADGAGGISGSQDFNVAGDFVPDVAFTGTYHINDRGEGSATLTSAGGATDIGFVVVSREQAFFTEIDGVEFAAGGFEKQDSAAFTSSTLDGPFVFSYRGFELGFGPVHAIGRIIGNGAGAITGGDQDISEAGFFSAAVPITSGSYSIAGTTGRGTASVTNSFGSTPFILYVVSPTRVMFMSRDPDLLALGTLERQAAGGFSTASLSGDYAFASSGTAVFGPIATVGRLSADGGGTLAQGILDENYAGFTSDGLEFTGSYAISATGRGTATTQSAGGEFSVVSRMVDADRFVFLHTESDRVVSGSARAQSGGLSTAALAGSYGLIGSVQTPDLLIDAIGTLSADGAANVAVDLTLAVAEFDPFMVGIFPLAGAGTYEVDASGRGVGSILGFSENVRLYMASPELFALLNLEQGEVGLFAGSRRF